MILYFENRYGNRRILDLPKDREDAWRAIKKFCDKKDYTIPYVRSWEEDGEEIFDVGSHTEFFILKELKGEV